MISRIVYENGCPFIEIDGKKYPPAAFRSFRPKPDNISLMKRCGMKLNQLLVSGLPCSNGNAYSLFGGVWKGDGVYDRCVLRPGRQAGFYHAQDPPRRKSG